MSATLFAHLVEIDETTRRVRIHRVFPDGQKQLYTEADLPRRSDNPNDPEHANFARMLGENILMDSPAARRLLGS